MQPQLIKIEVFLCINIQLNITSYQRRLVSRLRLLDRFLSKKVTELKKRDKTLAGKDDIF